MRKDRTIRRLAFERLETRALLAGEVTAQLMGGDLLVRGDHLDNRITIDRTPAGEIRVAGDDFTLVNGESAPAVFRNVVNIDIRTAGGADHVSLQGIRAGAALRIDTGAGDDTVLVLQSQVRGSFSLLTGSGHDLINLVASDPGKRSQIHSGAGDDVVTVERSKLTRVLFVNAGRGDDTIFVDRQTPRSKVAIIDGPGDDTITRDSIRKSFDFSRGAQGWQAGFADYPAGEEEFFELDSGIRPLPAELGPGTGFFIQGNNHSDDLFMFLRRRLGRADGVRPNQAYQLRLTIEFGSHAPTGCAGIGGAPGESVFLKAGASSRRPTAAPAEDGLLRMNVDKGDQAFGGTSASVVGNVANGVPCEEALGQENPPWVSLQRVHVHEFYIRANSSGEIWLVLGTDSGFEGLSAFYFQRIEAQLIPVASVPATRSEKLEPR
jgi:hypothetical protein